MNKLRNQILIAFNLFLLLVVGGMLLFYLFFAEDYYIVRKERVMNEAYQTIQQFDLTHLQPENEEVMLGLEEESFSILICNENMEPIYDSKVLNIKNQVQEQVAANKEAYTEDAKAFYRVDELWKPIVLYGKVTQADKDFYVYINENTRVIRRGIHYANRFLTYILIITMILGSVFAYLLAAWIVRPIERIQEVTSRLAQNDFSVRVPEHQPHNELGKLSDNINGMAEKIQRNINDLSNYNYLLLSQNRDMAEYEEMRKKMVGSMTHQLKTPLAIISSQVELLEFEYDNEKKEYYFSSIMEEIDKMSKLISSILQNTRIEHQLGAIAREKTDLTGMLQALLPKYQNWLESGKIRFESNIEPGCFAFVDSLQMEQAVNNYMMNAKRHTAAGDKVKLTLQSEDEGYYISVYNDGGLLEAEEMKQIWYSFYQTGKKIGGDKDEVGLGLYIVKDIMKSHYGDCGVLNREHGVEFWLRIPRG